MDNATSEIGKLNKMLTDQSKIADRSKVGNLLSTIQSVQLGGIAHELSELTGSSNNLTTSLEATFTQMTTQARPVAALDRDWETSC